MVVVLHWSAMSCQPQRKGEEGGGRGSEGAGGRGSPGGGGGGAPPMVVSRSNTSLHIPRHCRAPAPARHCGMNATKAVTSPAASRHWALLRQHHAAAQPLPQRRET